MQPLPFRVHQPLDAERLRRSCRRRSKTSWPDARSRAAAGTAGRRPTRRPALRLSITGTADEAHLALVEVALRHPLAEHRLARDLRHDHRLAALDHLRRPRPRPGRSASPARSAVRPCPCAASTWSWPAGLTSVTAPRTIWCCRSSVSSTRTSADRRLSVPDRIWLISMSALISRGSTTSLPAPAAASVS